MLHPQSDGFQGRQIKPMLQLRDSLEEEDSKSDCAEGDDHSQWNGRG